MLQSKERMPGWSQLSWEKKMENIQVPWRALSIIWTYNKQLGVWIPQVRRVRIPAPVSGASGELCFLLRFWFQTKRAAAAECVSGTDAACQGLAWSRCSVFAAVVSTHGLVLQKYVWLPDPGEPSGAKSWRLIQKPRCLGYVLFWKWERAFWVFSDTHKHLKKEITTLDCCCLPGRVSSVLCTWPSPLCPWGECTSRLEAALQPRGLRCGMSAGDVPLGGQRDAWKHNISHLAFPPPQTGVLFTHGNKKRNVSVSSSELAPACPCWCNCLVCPCPSISSVSVGWWYVDLVF